MSDNYSTITVLLKRPIKDEDAKTVLGFLKTFDWVADARLSDKYDMMENIGLWKYKSALREKILGVLD